MPENIVENSLLTNMFYILAALSAWTIGFWVVTPVRESRFWQFAYLLGAGFILFVGVVVILIWAKPQGLFD